MRTFIQMPSIVLSVFLSFSMLVLFCYIGGIAYAKIHLWEKKRSRIYFLMMLMQYFLFQCTVPIYYNRHVGRRLSFAWCEKIPFALLVCLEAFLTVIMLHMIYSLYQWQKSKITILSLKESVDHLPVGLCFYGKNGLPFLVNHKMESICLAICGEGLVDAEKFWNMLRKNRKTEEPMVRMEDGKTYRFSRNELQVDGQSVYELVAADITEQYELTMEKERKNIQLEKQNERMRNYSKRIGNIIREKEILEAKIMVHDQAGDLLLSSRHYLTLPIEERNRKELMKRWDQNIMLLKQEASPKETLDEYQQLLDAAKAVGVKIHFEEEQCPKEEVPRKLILAALHECLTNTIRHAKGDELRIRVTRLENRYLVTLTNNGEPPKEKIRETGGLKYLRKMVEDEKGRMEIRQIPEFVLEITIPRSEGK